MSFWRITVREIQHRTVRALLTLMSVALGTAAVVSVMLTTATVREAQASMFAALIGKTDLVISAEGGASLEASLIEKLRTVEKVREAVPSIHRSTILYTKERKARTQVLGVDPELDSLVRDYVVVEGERPMRGAELAVDERFAKSLGMQVGDSVRLLTRSGLQDWKLVGLVHHNGTSGMAQGGVLYAPLRTVQTQFRARQKVDRIELLVDEDANIESVQQSVLPLLPSGVTAKAPAHDNQMADQTMKSAEIGLALATGFALLIAVFTIFNTFQMVVGERRRQLGILRAVGATKTQVRRFILREAIVMGAAGTLLGSVLGVVGATFLTRATAKVLQSPMPDPQLALWPFVIAAIFGLGLSWAGAYLPAKRAGSLSPAEAMQRVVASEMVSGSRRWPIFGLFLMSIGMLVHASSFLGWLSMKWTIAASILLLVGVVFLLPLFVEPTSRVVQWLLRPIMGVESSLAYRQLLRHRNRTAMTASVLFIAISSGIGLGITIMDNVRNVDVWCRQALVGDFFVSAAMPDMSTGRSPDVPDDLEERIGSMPGVAKVTPLRFLSARSGENSVIVVIQRFRSAEEYNFDIVQGELANLRKSFQSDEVLIGSVLSERMDVHLGDILPMETLEGIKEFRVAGVVNDYIAAGLTVYMDRTTAEGAFQVEGQDAFVVDARPDQRLVIGEKLETICQEEGLLFQSNADLVEMIRSMSRGVNAGLWGLLALGSAIASFGLVNTLSMNIIEQTREIGLLRVIAMTRSQVRKMIFAQALLLGIVGFVPGAVMGGVVAFLINLSTYTATGHSVELIFRPWFFIAAVALALSMAIAASLIPAERAARVNLGAALGYE